LLLDAFHAASNSPSANQLSDASRREDQNDAGWQLILRIFDMGSPRRWCEAQCRKESAQFRRRKPGNPQAKSDQSWQCAPRRRAELPD
jgi:hypothetical protein